MPRLQPAKDAVIEAPRRLDPLKRETLQTRILAQLERRLITGQFKPGEKLILRVLAEQLGTSLMPVRDAVQHLQSIGALVAEPSRTLTVPRLDDAQLQELSEVRLVLEGMAVERAAVLADAAGLSRLRDRFAALRRTRDGTDLGGYLQAHWDFHLGIVELSGSPTLIAMLTSLWLRIGPTVQISERTRNGTLDALAYHQAIADAIAAGDGIAARDALEADIFYTIRRQDLSALSGRLRGDESDGATVRAGRRRAVGSVRQRR